LAPEDARLDLHPAHEGTTETACIRITETRGDIAYPLVGIREQLACYVETDFLYQFTVTSVHFRKMTLQRARTDAELARRTPQCRIAEPQRRDDCPPNSIAGGPIDALHDMLEVCRDAGFRSILRLTGL
jgi:hypothetical protein